jgi:hypothetical protein
MTFIFLGHGLSTFIDRLGGSSRAVMEKRVAICSRTGEHPDPTIGSTPEKMRFGAARV